MVNELNIRALEILASSELEIANIGLNRAILIGRNQGILGADNYIIMPENNQFLLIHGWIRNSTKLHQASKVLPGRGQGGVNYYFKMDQGTLIFTVYDQKQNKSVVRISAPNGDPLAGSLESLMERIPGETFNVYGSGY